MTWNKVTPLSKMVALVLFIALPFVGFWLGIQYGESIVSSMIGPGISGETGMSQPVNNESDYYSNVSTWQKDSNNQDFSIAYPIDFSYEDHFTPAPPSYDWRMNVGSDQPGIMAFTLTVPSALEPQTNFADAKLTVGYSANDIAVANCMKPDEAGPNGTATSSVVLGGTPFTVFNSSGAGAGNYYETTSYRALHAGQCWAVEYTIHSTQIANYPAEYGLKPFDKEYVAGILNRIVGTFSFTK